LKTQTDRMTSNTGVDQSPSETSSAFDPCAFDRKESLISS
jgi:hypothetical protein